MLPLTFSETTMLIFFVSGAIFIADRLTKMLTLQAKGKIEVLGDFVVFCLVRNEGLCFGLFSGQGSLIFWLTLLIIILIIGYVVIKKEKNRVFQIGIGLFLGGALGNLFDRAGEGVIDFISIGIGDLRWPTFNIADIGICVGVVLILIRKRQETSSKTL
ncbi:signal peptidase II [bacterium]|nr:signal peptidase II [bacterium]MBU2462334.1 signal peptidase II [bacterium]